MSKLSLITIVIFSLVWVPSMAKPPQNSTVQPKPLCSVKTLETWRSADHFDIVEFNSPDSRQILVFTSHVSRTKQEVINNWEKISKHLTAVKGNAYVFTGSKTRTVFEIRESLISKRDHINTQIELHKKLAKIHRETPFAALGEEGSKLTHEYFSEELVQQVRNIKGYIKLHFASLLSEEEINRYLIALTGPALYLRAFTEPYKSLPSQPTDTVEEEAKFNTNFAQCENFFDTFGRVVDFNSPNKSGYPSAFNRNQVDAYKALKRAFENRETSYETFKRSAEKFSLEFNKCKERASDGICFNKVTKYCLPLYTEDRDRATAKIMLSKLRKNSTTLVFRGDSHRGRLIKTFKEECEKKLKQYKPIGGSEAVTVD